jgi:predicted permease
MRTLWQDLRYAIRMLLRSPGFTGTVVGILAIGMGGSLMIFSVFNELVLRPFPVPEQERLVDLDETAPAWNLEYTGIAYPDFHEWRRSNQSFDCMTVWTGRGWNLALGDQAERIDSIAVTYDYFDVLHVQPMLGRRFVEEDDRPGAPHMAILSASLWQRLYGQDPGVIGRSVRLNGEPYTIVGVLPPEAVFPERADLWVPLAANPAEGGAWFLRGMGRLKPGVSLAAAQADLERIHRAMSDARPANKTTAPRLTPLRTRYMGEHQHVASLLLLAAGLVLLLACCNISGMMLAKGMTRARELAVRIALGAPRYRIVRQVLTETLLLCLLGAFLGAILGRVGLGLLLRSISSFLAPWMTFATDGRTLVFCAGVVGLATILSGLIPAMHAASGRDTESTLRATAARTTASISGRRSLHVLVTGEIALAMTLSVGAVLLLEAFWKVSRVTPGFRVNGILTYRITLPSEQYKDEAMRQAFFEDHLERLRALPGVHAASFSDIGPLAGHNGNFFDIEGVERVPGELNHVVLTQTVMTDYFETMGVELLAGRFFNAQDCRSDSPRTAIVNETFARRLGSNRDAVGKRIAFGGSKDWMEVIGVTRDVKHYGLDQVMRPAVYLPSGRNAIGSMTAVVHTTGDPLALVPAVRETLRSTGLVVPIYGIETMQERLHRSLWVRRTYSSLISVFAVVAAIMAVGGIYGIMSYSVSQRIQEMGIRLTLGARPADIVRHVLTQGGRLIGIGLAVGLIGALAMGQLMAGLLFGVSALDPRALLGVIVLLLVVTLLACWLPARRAAKVDPMTALRCE